MTRQIIKQYALLMLAYGLLTLVSFLGLVAILIAGAIGFVRREYRRFVSYLKGQKSPVHPTLDNLYDAVMDWSFEAFGDHNELGPEDSLGNIRHYAGVLDKDPNDKHAWVELLINLCDAMVRSESGIEFGDVTSEDYSKAAAANRYTQRLLVVSSMKVVRAHATGALRHSIDDPRQVAGIVAGIAERILDSEFTQEEIVASALAEVQTRSGQVAVAA